MDNQPNEFLGTLPEDLRANPALSSFKDASSLAKAFVDTKAMVGKRLDGMVKIPGEGATAEDVTAWRTARGVPEKPDGYALPELPQGAQLDEGRAKWFREAAHKAGLSPTEFTALAAAEMEHQAQAVAAMEAQVKEHYGAKLESAMKTANNALNRLPDELRQTVAPFLGFDLAFTRAMEHFGRLMGEDTSPDRIKTAETAISQLEKERAALEATPEYRDAHVSGHGEAVRKVFEIDQKLFEEKKKIEK